MANNDELLLKVVPDDVWNAILARNKSTIELINMFRHSGAGYDLAMSHSIIISAKLALGIDPSALPVAL